MTSCSVRLGKATGDLPELSLGFWLAKARPPRLRSLPLVIQISRAEQQAAEQRSSEGVSSGSQRGDVTGTEGSRGPGRERGGRRG